MGASDGERELVAFSLPSETGREREARDRVADAVAELSLDQRRLDGLRTAVSEAVTNAIEHGNAARAELPVDVVATATPERLRVRVSDRHVGAGAPVAAEEPDIEAKLRGEQSPRGWGLFLIRSTVDELHTFADERSGTVELIVHLHGGERDD